MKTMLAVLTAILLVTGSALSQEPDVTLSDVLLFTYPGAEWVLDEPSEGEPTLRLWESDAPQPTIAALEKLRDTPSEALLEAVRTGVFPEPPA